MTASIIQVTFLSRFCLFALNIRGGIQRNKLDAWQQTHCTCGCLRVPSAHVDIYPWILLTARSSVLLVQQSGHEPGSAWWPDRQFTFVSCFRRPLRLKTTLFPSPHVSHRALTCWIRPDKFCINDSIFMCKSRAWNNIRLPAVRACACLGSRRSCWQSGVGEGPTVSLSSAALEALWAASGENWWTGSGRNAECPLVSQENTETAWISWASLSSYKVLDQPENDGYAFSKGSPHFLTGKLGLLKNVLVEKCIKPHPSESQFSPLTSAKRKCWFLVKNATSLCHHLMMMRLMIRNKYLC